MLVAFAASGPPSIMLPAIDVMLSLCAPTQSPKNFVITIARNTIVARAIVTAKYEPFYGCTIVAIYTQEIDSSTVCGFAPFEQPDWQSTRQS